MNKLAKTRHGQCKERKRRYIFSKVGRQLRMSFAPKRTKRPFRRQYLNPVMNPDDVGNHRAKSQEHIIARHEQTNHQLDSMCSAIRTLIECMGENPDREGLRSTPLRCAKALLFLTKGYQESVDTIVNQAFFEESHREMIVVKNIEVYSLCEHHLLPFTGKVITNHSHIVLKPGLIKPI